VRAAVVPEAGVDAEHIDARVFGRAVAVAKATDDLANELSVRVETGAAAAFGLVFDHVTLGVRSADVREEAGIHAISIDTGFVRAALGVSAALGTVASDLGVAFVSRLARTRRPMVLHVANGVCAAVAGLAALAVYA
jgi:hypothetical protein